MNQFLADSFKIAVLLNPFAVLSTFIALTGQWTPREKAKIMLRTCLAAMTAGIVVMFSGNIVFSLIDINIDLFKVGGGVVLMICSISLVWGNESKIRKRDASDTSVFVVPLAIPMAVGPGTAAGLILIGTEHTGNLMNYCSNIGALLVGIVVLAGVLSLGVWSEKVMSKTTISVITRLTGLFLSAIAAKMILEGIRSFLNL